MLHHTKTVNIYPTLTAREGFVTRSFSKRKAASFNLVYYFSMTSCLASMPDDLPMAGWRKNGFTHGFHRAISMN